MNARGAPTPAELARPETSKQRRERRADARQPGGRVARRPAERPVECWPA